MWWHPVWSPNCTKLYDFVHACKAMRNAISISTSHAICIYLRISTPNRPPAARGRLRERGAAVARCVVWLDARKDAHACVRLRETCAALSSLMRGAAFWQVLLFPVSPCSTR